MYYGEVIAILENDNNERVHKVMIWSTASTPPTSMTQVKNVGDDIKLAVGSCFVYPEGGDVHFWMSDESWHKWGG